MNCLPVALEDHDQLRLELMSAGRELRDTVGNPSRFQAARQTLVGFYRQRLLPHLDRDERWLTQAERCDRTWLLADAMRAESRQITAAMLDAEAADPCEAVAATRVVHILLAAHARHARHLRAALAGDFVPQSRP